MRDLLDRLWDLADDIDTSTLCGSGLQENIFAEAAETIAALRSAAGGEQLAAVWQDWLAYQEATTPVTQADALLTFANAFYHYATNVLGFDHTVGTEDTDGLPDEGAVS